MLKGKMVVEQGLTNSCEKKRSESQRQKGKIHPFEFRVPKQGEIRKPSSVRHIERACFSELEISFQNDHLKIKSSCEEFLLGQILYWVGQKVP